MYVGIFIYSCSEIRLTLKEISQSEHEYINIYLPVQTLATAPQRLLLFIK